MRKKILLSLSIVAFLFAPAFAEEVIWRKERGASSEATVPDRVSNDPPVLGPMGEFSDYLLAQVLVQCNPGQPRVGLPGTANQIRTFFENDATVNFDALPGSTQNPDTGNFEIDAFARLNVFEISSPNDLPFPNQNPDQGIEVPVKFIQDLNADMIIVLADDLINQLQTPLIIRENIPLYIGLTPIFVNFSQPPFGGIHFTDIDGVGGENQSAVRQTAPTLTEWDFAGFVYGPPKTQFATIRINGPPMFKIGDVNQDGLVNLLDIQPFVESVSNGLFTKEADVNGDGFVNLLDVEPFVDLLSGV